VRYFAVGCLLVVLGLQTSSAAGQSRDSVRSIVVEGAQRIEPETVRSYLLIREGDLFDSRRIDRSLKSLFATGLFADVSLRREGNALVVNVVENPVINRIAFEGNKHLGDEILGSEVVLRPRVIYTRTKVQNDVKRILTLYRVSGRFAATVEPKVIQLPQNRVDLVFEVNEGEPTEVQSIRFVGNEAFDDSRLREIIRTRESRWWRFLSSDDTYDPDRMTLDRELLRRFYLVEGYADFRVVSGVAELTPDRRDFFITFMVDEGKRYRFGKVDVEARLRDLKAEDLTEAIEIEEGDWYNSDVLELTIEKLTDAVGTLGYAFVDVRPRINRDRENLVINLTFEVNEGPRVFVERIDINGNVRTAGKVIRREFRLVEGDAFNAAKLRRSRERIQRLDFFEKVNVEQIPGSAPDKTIVRVDVEEKSTGTLSLGAGFSTSSGPLADIGIQERNLLGLGMELRLNLLIAALRSEIDLSFTDPFFLDRDLTAGFDVFRTSRDLQDESSFDTESIGGAVRLGYPITENMAQGWKYTLRRQKITDIADDASRLIREEEGTQTLSEISHTLSYDTRNSRVAPSTGFTVRMTNDIAGFGGNNQYFRNRVKGARYFPLSDQWVFSVRGSAGQIVGLDQDVRLLDRFFVGGDDLRGFATSGIGPRDRGTKDALGGEWMYTASAEMTFPLGLPAELGVTGKVFSDMGSTGEVNPSGPEVADTGSVRASVGAGVVWASPFGPVGIDLGIPLLSEDFDEEENFRVSFGARF
jgi:outer membrane protein insertion porin family